MCVIQNSVFCYPAGYVFPDPGYDVIRNSQSVIRPDTFLLFLDKISKGKAKGNRRRSKEGEKRLAHHIEWQYAFYLPMMAKMNTLI